jgi:hypothetical protein
VDQTPRFDEIIMEDIRPNEGWLYNVETGTLPPGTPVEVVQDRFRVVYPNVTKLWNRVYANGPGCQGHPCDLPEHQIGWGADRLTWYAEQQNWGTPLICYDSNMHITHFEEHISQIISDILKPATIAISSGFLRKRHLLWSNRRHVANGNLGAAGTDGVLTYTWTAAGSNGDEEMYLDCSASPSRVFKLAPQMLQRRFNPLMLRGYAGKNPFKDTSPFIEFVSDMDTTWELDHLGGQTGVGGGSSPNVLGNWRFQDFDATGKYWRYGFSGQIGNFMVRVDPMQLRFNYVTDLGAGAAPNRYRYQVVLPYKNSITTGAGGAAGIGSDYNSDYDRSQFSLSQIHHKSGMQLLTPDGASLHNELPFGHRDFGGKWQAVMDNLGADQAGQVIENKRRNKLQFIADFKYWVRPKHTEFLEVFFHRREQFCIPEISCCNADPGYPSQIYESGLPGCTPPAAYNATYGTGVPTDFSSDGSLKASGSRQDGPRPTPVDESQTTQTDL